MGKPEQEVVKKREGPRKSPISKFWIGTYLTSGRRGSSWSGNTDIYDTVEAFSHAESGSAGKLSFSEHAAIRRFPWLTYT